MPEVSERLKAWKENYEKRIVESAVDWYLSWCRSVNAGGKCEINEEMIERFIESVKDKGDTWLKNFIKGITGGGKE